MRFPTMCIAQPAKAQTSLRVRADYSGFVRPAKAQTSLRIRAVWSESLLVA